jgi:mannose-6-phosphate isomerase-like protein (cupin superfamily)
MSKTKVIRPWGSYSSLLLADNHQVKEIVVAPGQRLSLQSHEHRSEHWIVIQGPALITVDDQEKLFNPGEHIFIPKKARHRLANPGTEPIEIVEVQLGDYLGEDDIVRYADDYQRDVRKKDLK